MPYRLLADFEELFHGRFYNHRVFNNGDFVAVALYEDLLTLGRSPKYLAGMRAGTRVVNTTNVRPGVAARRGDGTFGQSLPHVDAFYDPSYSVPRGKSADIALGVEVKIVCKAMIRQVGRVMNDLTEQAAELKHKSPEAICVGVVGVNFAPYYVSFEGDREWRTTGKGRHKHPVQEAAEVVARVRAKLTPVYDELLILPFRATNEAPFNFEWVDSNKTNDEYGAALVRISQLYEKRF